MTEDECVPKNVYAERESCSECGGDAADHGCYFCGWDGDESELRSEERFLSVLAGTEDGQAQA